MGIEESVSSHYGAGNLLQFLLGIVSSSGGNPDSFSPSDLRGADQLHIGGPAATTRVATRAGIRSGSRVLDLGSGMGGVRNVVAEGPRATGGPSRSRTSWSRRRQECLSSRASGSTCADPGRCWPTATGSRCSPLSADAEPRCDEEAPPM